MGEYWRVLGEASITRERLASYERKITEEPWYKPEAIGDFENYLQILKRMHSSDDMNLLIGEAWGHVGTDTHGLMKAIQQGPVARLWRSRCAPVDGARLQFKG